MSLLASQPKAVRVSAASAPSLQSLALHRSCHFTRRSPFLLRASPEPTKQAIEQQAPPAAEREELPPWVRRERERELQASAPKGLPWPLLLLFSSFVAMASVGSMFEIANRHALFGVIQPDNFLWFPILGLFAATGLPTAGYLFFKGVQGANEEAERQDRLDGYID